MNIYFPIPLLAIAITLFVYFKNKQSDKSRHRRERYEDKQVELLELLRNNKNKAIKEDHAS